MIIVRWQAPTGELHEKIFSTTGLRTNDPVSLAALMASAHTGEVGAGGVQLEIEVAAGCTMEVSDDVTGLECDVVSVVLKPRENGTVFYRLRPRACTASKAQLHITATMASRGSKADIEICHHAAEEGSEFVLCTRQDHTASDSTSNVDIRGVSSAKTKMSIDTTIYIGPQVAGVVANQKHRQLVLDLSARVHAEPKLEVLSNDVSCAHGSAVRHFDDDQLFYLQSRSLTENEAKNLLINAFLRKNTAVDESALSI